jgi:hypothetical protein
MTTREPRILVLMSEKGRAENVARGLLAMGVAPADLDVLLCGEPVPLPIDLKRYDLLVLSLEESEEIVGRLTPSVPVITVGGVPAGCPRVGPDLLRVPIPLSFNLLAQSVRAALAGGTWEWGDASGLRDSVG